MTGTLHPVPGPGPNLRDCPGGPAKSPRARTTHLPKPELPTSGTWGSLPPGGVQELPQSCYTGA